MYIDAHQYCRVFWQSILASGELVTCVSCGCYVRPEDAVEHNPDQFLCSNCCDERSYNCEGCGKMLFDGPDTIWWSDEDECYCEACYRTHNIVAAYDFFEPNPIFLKLTSERTRKDTLFFGMEFEIEMDWGKCARNYYTENQLGKIMTDGVPSGVDWGYVKHDGSMKSGVEFVTNPMTEAFYRQNRKVIDLMFDNWKASGFRTDQWDDEQERYNCSLHIHMSKDAFMSGHLYKFVRFFYKIPMRKFVQSVSQRGENEYAQWFPDDFIYGAKLAKEKKNCSMNRYSVINLIGGHWHEQTGQPAKTVEFRLFQGSMDPTIIHKNIEFMLSVFYFTRDTSITHITQKNYLKYLKAFRNRYRYLINFLNTELGKGV
jgi:hypothetical protein